MPFPLAHPAAVLPLRRYCPRLLNFPALVIGSLIPDLSYCSGRLSIARFAHDFLGTIGFSLPLGLVAVWGFYTFRGRVVARLPERWRGLFMPVSQRAPGPVWTLAISLVLGAWTHILLDSVTHRDGWLVQQRLPVLLQSVGTFLHHQVTLYQVLWFSCTFAGVAWVAAAYLGWLQRATGSRVLGRGKVRGCYALGGASLAILLALSHRLVHQHWEMYAVIGAMLALAAGFVWMTGRISQSEAKATGSECSESQSSTEMDPEGGG